MQLAFRSPALISLAPWGERLFLCIWLFILAFFILVTSGRKGSLHRTPCTRTEKTKKTQLCSYQGLGSLKYYMCSQNWILLDAGLETRATRALINGLDKAVLLHCHFYKHNSIISSNVWVRNKNSSMSSKIMSSHDLLGHPEHDYQNRNISVHLWERQKTCATPFNVPSSCQIFVTSIKDLRQTRQLK